MGILQDIEPDRILYIRQIKEDDIIAPTFGYLFHYFVIEISMWIYESDSTACVYILEHHPL